MSSFLAQPLVLTGIVLGMIGIALLVQSRLQVRMLRHRVSTGAGTAVVDPSTGLFSAAAAWQSIRGEANRARRLQRPLDVWIGRPLSSTTLDELGHDLLDTVPTGAIGVRLGRGTVCVLSCSAEDVSGQLHGSLEWSNRRIAPEADAATKALAYVSEVVGG